MRNQTTKLLCGWKTMLGFLLLSGLALQAIDLQVAAMLTKYSGQYARVYETDADRTNNVTLTTWPRAGRMGVNGGQGTATYCGVHEISSSASWFYYRTTGLASHVMGPWYTSASHTALFMNMPKNSAAIFRIPRTAQVQAGTKTLTSLGPVGIAVDGVLMFDGRDAFSVSAPSGTEANPGLGIWNRDAYVNESPTFDPALAHQPNNGQYHYHVDPLGLRHLLGDNVRQDPVTRLYSENTTNATPAHSPIIGWVRDGYPVYGPYGYSNATNPATAVRRMISGFVARNTNSPGVLTRTSIPAWAQRAQSRTTLIASQYGPAVSSSYPLGRYLEDNDYLGDLGFAQGVDFDLDEYNGRVCVTPEFPSGTYAYFVSIGTNGLPTFPYVMGRQFYGVASGGNVGNVPEPVTTNFVGGPNIQLRINSVVRNSTFGDATLTWVSVDGATYQIDATTNVSPTAWGATKSNVASKGILTDATENGTVAAQRFYRVQRTGLAPYDSTGF